MSDQKMLELLNLELQECRKLKKISAKIDKKRNIRNILYERYA